MKVLVLISIALFTSLARAEDKPQRVLPEFNLTSVTVDKTSQVTRKDFDGKVWIVDFMFTRCHGTCPLNSAKMEALQEKLPPDILLASFTVDPTNDQEAALRAYAQKYHAKPGRWMFLTAANEEALLPLFKGSFGTAYRKTDKTACGYETWHTSKFFLLKGTTILSEYNPFAKTELEKLIADAQALAAPAAEKSVNSKQATNGGAK